MENEGRLSERGRFRTDRDDLRLLVEHHLPAACKLWKLGTGDSIDVAVYAHGGLPDEEAAAKTARIWIPLLSSNRIFPRSEERRVGTGCVSTCRSRVSPQQ